MMFNSNEISSLVELSPPVPQELFSSITNGAVKNNQNVMMNPFLPLPYVPNIPTLPLDTSHNLPNIPSATDFINSLQTISSPRTNDHEGILSNLISIQFYLDSHQTKSLSLKTGLNIAQISKWFSNRRKKLRVSGVFVPPRPFKCGKRLLSEFQVSELRREYELDAHPCRAKRAEIAARIGMSYKDALRWYEYQRSKQLS